MTAPTARTAPPAVHRLTGHLLTPEGWLRGCAEIADGRLQRVHGEPVTEDQARADHTLPLLMPGFIDLHVHGGGGADVMDAGDAVRTLARVHARRGTTALLATTVTAPAVDIEAALRAVAAAVAQPEPASARVLGVHLEGPYIAPQRLGAQPPHSRAPQMAELSRWCALAPIRVLTLAPDNEAALALIPDLVALGLRVQIGHSDASYEQACAALRAGATGFTHLFNAMSPLHHRAPGTVGAALAHARHAEVIPDLLHVHPGALRAAVRAVPGLYAVTDATAATGMPDGDYRLGRHTVTRCQNAVRLANGTLAGSVLTMDQALRNLVQLGLPVAEAALRTSGHAAHYLGLADRGCLAVGAWADVVALHPHTLQLQQVIVEGEAI
jgi:N-acetylglucosamine-6-phosphate deacetylase